MAYSDAFVTEALIRLAVNKYDYKKTAEQLLIPEMTLRRWESNKNVTKKGIPELLDRAIERMLMVIPDKWDGNSWAIALGILIDKWLLLQGEPTSRSESLIRGMQEVSQNDRDAIIQEAERILAAVRARSGDISSENPDTN
jgi:hypothetical protein